MEEDKGSKLETLARGVCVRDGAILLCVSKDGGYSYLPGGHVELGETFAQALEREMREEAGGEFRAGELLAAVENRFIQKGEEHQEVSLLFRMDAPQGNVVSQENWIAFKWTPLEELPDENLLPRGLGAEIPAIIAGEKRSLVFWQ